LAIFLLRARVGTVLFGLDSGVACVSYLEWSFCLT
jgi:hypothetical protein